MMFSGVLTAYLGDDGKSIECEGFEAPTITDLCRRFLEWGFSSNTPLIVKRRQGKTEIEVATIKLIDPLRRVDFDLHTLEAAENVEQ